jgi:ketosteroid isomerase-like protein
VRLEIATGGDLAYEYSTMRLSFVRTSDKQKIEVEGAVLRVWRKTDGGWKIAAAFQRPHDDSPTPR